MESGIVDIRKVDAIYGLKYTLKYLKKAPTVSGHEQEYNEVLKGTRLVQAWGSWYGEVRAKEVDDAPKLVEHFVSPCQAKPLVDGKVEADKTAVRTVSDAG